MIFVFCYLCGHWAIDIDTAWLSRDNVRFDGIVRMVVRGKGITFIGDWFIHFLTCGFGDRNSPSHLELGKGH